MMREVPGILFKYCRRNGIDILQTLRLKITPIGAFNDPLELAPRMRPDFPIEDARAYVLDESNLRNAYEKLPDGIKKAHSFEFFKEEIERRRVDSFARNLVESYADDAKELNNEYMAAIREQFGLICLTAVPNNILMWAHYTDCHKGFVIGFDTQKEIFSSLPLLEVDYQEERVEMGHRADHRNPPWHLLTELVVRRKSSHWKYEQEWRQLRDLSQCNPAPDPEKAGRMHYHLKLTPEVITHIITGVKCDTAAMDELLKGKKFGHVRYQRAQLHDTEFKIDLIDV